MCKSDNEPQKADLTTRFDDIKFTVNDNDTILCNENRWMYENIGNEGMSRSTKKQVSEEENNQDELKTNMDKMKELVASSKKSTRIKK